MLKNKILVTCEKCGTYPVEEKITICIHCGGPIKEIHETLVNKLMSSQSTGGFITK